MNPTPSRLFDLTGKVALITGGSRGIGRAVAIGMAEHGADVAIIYASAAGKAQEVVDQIRRLGRRAWAYQQELGRLDELHALADRVWQDAGRVDILVNNAAISALVPFNQITIEQWRQLRAVNLDAPFFLSQRIAEHMIAAGIKGRIINVSSKNGFVASSHLAHYNACKGGLELLTQSLAIELGEHGITVNSLAPGDIDTDMAGALDLETDFWRYLLAHVPLEHRLGKPRECVGPTVFLASDAASYMTGQHVIFDGGFISQQVPRMQFMQPYRNTIAPGAKHE